MGIREPLRVVEVGRIFPTLVRKLRHGPLCKASLEARGPTRVLVSNLDKGPTTDSRLGQGVSRQPANKVWDTSGQVCDQSGRCSAPSRDPSPAPGGVEPSRVPVRASVLDSLSCPDGRVCIL